MARFDGKVAVVLGAAGRDNLGQAIARRLAREGARVVVAGRHIKPLDALATEIGGEAVAADATRETDVAALADRAIERFGALDIAVNATGRNLVRPLLETTRDDLMSLADIQFVAPFLFLKTMVSAMKRGGSIVHLSSVTARIMMRDHAAYTGTKAGMEQVVRAFAYEFGERGIRINGVSPGLTRTPMTSKAFENPEFVAFRAASMPMRRLGTPDDVAAAVAWLCDPECFITGEILQANGGASLLTLPAWSGGSH